MKIFPFVLGACLLLPQASRAQHARRLMPIDFEHSAEASWLRKPVHARRSLDDMTQPQRWRFSGTGALSFPAAPRLGDMRVLRVDMTMFRDAPAPNRSRLSSVNLQRDFAGEDWSGYNRVSMWIRPEIVGVPTMPLQLVLHNDGAEKVPDRYGREGHHYVTLAHGGWQQVVWEIDPLPRDRVTRLEIGYWLNRMLSAPGDTMAFEIGRLELQRVDPDTHTGWQPAAGTVAFSHSGYSLGASKSAIVTVGSGADTFALVRVDDTALGEVVLRKPVQPVQGPGGTLGQLDFSEVERSGRYVLRHGDQATRPFTIGGDTWKSSVWKTLNFFYGNRCGFDVPGVHGVDHLDWFAVHGDERLTMSGGWHDAGDLSQGVINTGEGTYAMFALAEELAARSEDPALVERLLEEAKWGLAWVMRVRFDGGYRIGFGSHNLWTNNVPGDADDRVVEAKNNPNANYIAAAAGAIAARVLLAREPELAARALRIAEDDWEHAIAGVEGPSTWHTPAFAASAMELAAIGVTASLDLHRVTRRQRYLDKAVELAKVITQSQQPTHVGTALPLAGFFYTTPARDMLFHQFHRAADQAPVVALAMLVEQLPDHPDWMQWYAAVVRHAEYQKRTAALTMPYGVLPAYVYRLADSVNVPVAGDRYGASREAYAAQVLAGTPMGDGWYLRTFPVWYSRRGNYGVLLSQAKGLAAASRLRGDSAGLDLAHRQAQWVVGRNPFAQSTMYGEGYDWAQQYSVSSGDFVGSLPVGMQSRGTTDLPYWPAQNMYVYKEVWVHSSNRWLWLMQDLMPPPAAALGPARSFTLGTANTANGEFVIRLTATGEGTRTFTLRTANLAGSPASQSITMARGAPRTIQWRVRRVDRKEPWLAVVSEQGVPRNRREISGQ